MIKTFALTVLAVLWTAMVFAQQSTMQRFIDKDQVVFVVNMHPGATYNKLNKETKDKYKIHEVIAPMLLQFAGGQPSDELVKKVSAQLEDPNKVGINVKDDVYLWGQRPTSKSEELYKSSDLNVLMINMVIPVTDSKKFKKFLQDILSDQRKEEVVTSGSNSTVLSRDMIATWNNERVIISGTTMDYNFFEDREEFEERREKALFQHALDLTKVDPKKSLEGNKDFQTSLDKEADMSFWADYGSLMVDADMVPREMRGLYKSLSKLTEKTLFSGQGYFKEGEAEIKTSMSLNPSMKRVTDAAYSKGGINKKFFKYVDKTNLMGLYSFSLDLKSFMMTYGQEIHAVLKEQDTKETRIAMNMMDILDIFLDEEETYELFTGDMMMALTDMRVIKREVSDFKYNEESNTWEEETEMIDDVMPVVSFMMAYGNEANLRHFIDLGVNMGGLEKKQEGVWTIPQFKEDMGTDLYIIIKDGLLIMTNDDLIAKNLNGLPASKQLSAASVNEMAGYVMYGMLDATQISRVAQQAYKKNDRSMPNEIMELEKIFSKVELKSMTPNNGDFKTDLYVRMKDQKANALQFLMDNMEEMMNGGRSNQRYQEEEEAVEEVEEEEEGVKRL
ncbi:MAG: DUF4836 family protein [Aureispira sp.]